MPSYLEQLTLRLAAGVGQLPEPTRARHAAFLRAAQNDEGGFSGREGVSDLYYTGFALRGLALTGELQNGVASSAAGFLKSKFTSQAPIIDFLSLIYGAMLLEVSAGIDIFDQSPPGWQAAVAQAMEHFRRPDGGYAKTDQGQSSSTYNTFLVVICHELLGQQLVEPERIVEFVRSRRRDDGGFVEIGPMRRSGTNPTAAAAALLNILDAWDDALREDVIDYLVDRQTDEGGFAANTQIPVADVLSTFTALLTLSDLNAIHEIDIEAAMRYVKSMEMPDGGFRGGIWDDAPAADVEYSFYGIGALAIGASPSPSPAGRGWPKAG